MEDRSSLALPSHIPALDGLRGAAILAVMLFHFFYFGRVTPGALIDWVPVTLASFGWVGVDLFFVLSGFLITGILVDSRQRPSFFRAFYVRRTLRIFPLYYGAITVFFVALPLMFPSAEVVQANTRGQLWFWSYFSNVQTAVHGWGATSFYVDHFWSLAVEEQFYLIWPLLVFFFSPRAMLRMCAILVVSSLALRVWLHAGGLANAAYVLTPARMDALAVGAALAIAMRDRRLARWVIQWAKPTVIAAGALLIAIGMLRGGLRYGDPVVGTVGFTLLALAFGGLVVLAIADERRTATLFSMVPLRFLGKYSYALYVFHNPIAALLPALGISAAILPPIAGSTLAGQLVFTMIAFSLSLVGALMSWHLYEKHFLRLKYRFSHGATPAALPPRQRPVHAVTDLLDGDGHFPLPVAAPQARA